jgi:3-methyladenine DNA glycosylase AlkD
MKCSHNVLDIKTGIIEQIRNDLRSLADDEDREILRQFFKTGPGEYGEGDQFLGIRVPAIRKLVRSIRFSGSPRELDPLLESPIHEERMFVLLVLIERYRKSDEKERNVIFGHYLRKRCHVNNWDLVDLSAPAIPGEHLRNERHPEILFELADSDSLWDRRIAIVSTLAFIRAGRFDTTLKIAERLLDDPHDLIHKATGWMLREVGKRSPSAETEFLDAFSGRMPRTMLRYAIEKFPEPTRLRYLKTGQKSG